MLRTCQIGTFQGFLLYAKIVSIYYCLKCCVMTIEPSDEFIKNFKTTPLLSNTDRQTVKYLFATFNWEWV